LQRYHFLQQILEEETLLIFNSPNFLYVLPHIQQLQGDGVATRMLFNLGKDLLEGTLNAIYFGLQRAQDLRQCFEMSAHHHAGLPDFNRRQSPTIDCTWRPRPLIRVIHSENLFAVNRPLLPAELSKPDLLLSANYSQNRTVVDLRKSDI
jgi:hypothetical protein